MNQITLYRKGGRKPWVFEYDELNNVYYCQPNRADKYTLYKLRLYHTGEAGVNIDLWQDAINMPKSGSCNVNGRYLARRNVGKEIHADHFKLGNVTITFD